MSSRGTTASSSFSKGEWIKGIAHWREGDTAYLSVAFTWRMPEAKQIALYYQSLGCDVIAGGPATMTQGKYLAGVATVLSPRTPDGRRPDMLVRHNPMATRASYGCPVGCWFCTVPKMDGKEFTLLDNFPVRPVLCDDNLSALPAEFQQHIVDRYLREGVPLIDANSGFEPKTFDEEVLRRWQPILKGPWRFGFDEKTEGSEVDRVFRMLKDVPARRKQVYTMIGHEPFDVCMDRIRRVIAAGAEPYAQPFLKLNALSKDPDPRHDWTIELLRKVQRWVNRRLWRYCAFADYDASVKSAPRAKALTGPIFDLEAA